VPGDLVFLYIAQDGDFNETDTIDFGALLNSSSAGTWQINRVTSNDSNSNGNGIIEFECDLDPAFLNRGHSLSNYYTMVITKIIVADVLTIEENISLRAGPFTSQSNTTNSGGGIVAIIANAIQMASGSRISADAAGFSGGTVETTSAYCYLCEANSCSVANYSCASSDTGGQKGASIASYSEDPGVRGYCRGALANGGGGGNNHNAAGGGGANVCNQNSVDWTGNGVSCTSYIT